MLSRVAFADGRVDVILDSLAVSRDTPSRDRWIFHIELFRGLEVGSSRWLSSLIERHLDSVYAALIEAGVKNYVVVLPHCTISAETHGDNYANQFLQRELVHRRRGLEPRLSFELWDQVGLLRRLSRHPGLLEIGLGQDADGSGPSTSPLQSPEFELLAGEDASGIDDETFFALLQELLGDSPWIMAPGSDSVLWALYVGGQFQALEQPLKRLHEELRSRRARMLASPERGRAAAWVELTRALVAAKVGRPRRSLKILDAAVGLTAADGEYDAWAWNIRSIAYGKLEDGPAYRISTDKAITVGREVGLPWISQTAELRRLHKESWAAAEGGHPLPNEEFEASILGVSTGSDGLSRPQMEHVLAQQEAYLALQYTWQPPVWDLAETFISRAQRRFDTVGDASELARMASERGRLYLLSRSDSHAVKNLQRGVQRRMHGGEFPRARYDLLWLGQGLVRLGMTFEAETCFYLALSIHEELYGNRKVDKGVVQDIRRQLRTTAGGLAARGAKARLSRDYLREAIEGATSLPGEDSSALIDLDRLSNLIVRAKT